MVEILLTRRRLAECQIRGDALTGLCVQQLAPSASTDGCGRRGQSSSDALMKTISREAIKMAPRLVDRRPGEYLE